MSLACLLCPEARVMPELVGSTDLEEVGDGILPWPQALGKSTSDWCPPSWCTWEVRGHSKASRVRGELASGQRTPVVALEPTLSRILNFCTFCPAPILPLPGVQTTYAQLYQAGTH